MNFLLFINHPFLVLPLSLFKNVLDLKNKIKFEINQSWL